MSSGAQKRLARENLEKANTARREYTELRRELREGSLDPLELIKGHSERYEPLIAKAPIRKVLPLVPGIGPSQTIELIVALDVPSGRKIGLMTFQRRAELAQMVRDILEVNV